MILGISRKIGEDFMVTCSHLKCVDKSQIDFVAFGPKLAYRFQCGLIRIVAPVKHRDIFDGFLVVIADTGDNLIKRPFENSMRPNFNQCLDIRFLLTFCFRHPLESGAPKLLLKTGQVIAYSVPSIRHRGHQK